MSKSNENPIFNPDNVRKNIENIPLKVGPHIKKANIFLSQNTIFLPNKPINSSFFSNNNDS